MGMSSGEAVKASVEKTCAGCKNGFQVIQNDRPYMGCRLAGDEIEGHLAALMRQGACGADASLWEAK